MERTSSRGRGVALGAVLLVFAVVASACGSRLPEEVLAEIDGERVGTTSGSRGETEAGGELVAGDATSADAEGVVAFFPDFGLVAYAPDGKERWSAPLGPFKSFYGMAASPLARFSPTFLWRTSWREYKAAAQMLG